MGKNWMASSHTYQRKSLKFALSRRSAALLLDPGLGKTSIAYAYLKMLLKQDIIDVAFVVAPRRPAVSVWPQEQEEWEDFHSLKVLLLHGAKKEAALEDNPDTQIYILTYDGWKWLKESGWLKKILRKKKRAALVFDELSKMKNTKSERFKRFKKDLGRFEYRLGLTGSPASNGLLNLFGQAYALDSGAAFGPYVTYFKAEFFDAKGKYPGDPYPVWVPKPGAEEKIYQRMNELAIRIDGEDHLQLPQLIYNPQRFDLSPQTQKYYDDMEEQMFLALPQGTVLTAKTAATVSMKCRQITSGSIYEDAIDPLTGLPLHPGKRRRPCVDLHSEKVEMLMDHIDELQGQQCLVAYEFFHEAERIEAALKREKLRYAVVGGGTSDKKALEHERAWNAGELDILLGHPASIGHGLNLQKSFAQQIVWFSGTWDFELYDQFIRRLKRQGNTSKHVTVTHLIARGTVDEAVFSAMQRKRKTQNLLLDALKDLRKSRK